MITNEAHFLSSPNSTFRQNCVLDQDPALHQALRLRSLNETDVVTTPLRGPRDLQTSSNQNRITRVDKQRSPHQVDKLFSQRPLLLSGVKESSPFGQRKVECFDSRVNILRNASSQMGVDFENNFDKVNTTKKAKTRSKHNLDHECLSAGKSALPFSCKRIKKTPTKKMALTDDHSLSSKKKQRQE